MLTLQHLRGARRVLLCGLFGLSMLVQMSCATGVSFDPTSLIIDALKSNLILIRVANQTGFDIEIDIQVDDDLITLPVCTATDGACDFLIDKCPTSVAVVEERWLTTDAVATGGRNFEGDPDFTFETGEFECGAFFLFEFAAQTAEASVLN